MPLVRIDLKKGKCADYIRQIGDGVHRALVETYNVPNDDRFQIITQHEFQEIIFDENYLGVRRSDDVVFIQIIAGKWRDTDTKKRFYKRTAELLAQRPGLRPEDVQIIISPNDRNDWSFGNGLASYVKDAALESV
jgi:phenylpyruvate tautomerase PptA (4-oxalocrotonate tautomerase family)